MSLSRFQRELENDLKKSVKFTINDNRSTMLSVRWEPDCTKVSIHRFFEKAPKNVMDSLACYIRQEEDVVSLNVKSFIEKNIHELNYTNHLHAMALNFQGKIYNLKALLSNINKEYFDNSLDLNITWYAQKKKKNQSQIIFGLYHCPLKLIKINQFLDSPKVPEYLVSYVIYHEMLHNVYPSYYDEAGKRRIHHKEFKKREAQYKYYEMAQEWIEKNREKLF